MSGPVAGWYPDPADPGQQRWWGGVEWTSDVRPHPAPQPPLLDVPGGGVNPFAEIDAQEARLTGIPAAAPGYPALGQQAAAPAAGWSASPMPPVYGGQPAQGGPPVFVPPPTNGLATAGLILALCGLYALGIVFSIRGLQTAKKFERWGDAPVGRKRARWGLGISIAAPLALAAAASVLVPVLVTQGSHMADDGVVRGPLGLPAVYDQDFAEQQIYDAWAAEGETVTDVQCPREADLVVGGGYECTMFYLGMTHRVGIVYTDTAGNFYQTFDGLIPQ